MRTALVICALLLICGAAHANYIVSVESAGGSGHGVRLDGGKVLTVAHILHADSGKQAKAALVNDKPAGIIVCGGTGVSESTDDDACDWALLRCGNGDSGAELAQAEAGGVYSFYHGRTRKQIVVVSIDDGVAAFTGSGPLPGDSGTPVWDEQGRVVGLITTRAVPCKGICPVGNPTGWFCVIGPEIEAAITAATE